MALTFLRHHRKKTLLSKSAAAAAAAASQQQQQQQQQTPSSTVKQDTTAADDESVASETPSVVVGEIPRSPDEEQDSGICPDSGSDFSRQGSSDNSWAGGKDGLKGQAEEEGDSDDDCHLRGSVGEDQNISTASCEDPSAGFVSAMPGDVPDIVPESVFLYRNINPEPEEPISGPVDDSDSGSRDSLHEVQSPTVPPAPPPPGLDLRGDHTTSSTTDADGDREVDRLFGRRKTVSTIPEAEPPPPLSFTTRPTVDYELRLPQGKAIFYQARIGVAPEDTELGMLFRKRANRNRKQSGGDDEDSRPVHRTDAKQENFTKSSTQNEASKLESVENAKSPENVETEANSVAKTTEHQSQQKTDDCGDREDSFSRRREAADDEEVAEDSDCIAQESGNTAYDKSRRETTDSGESGFNAVVEAVGHLPLREEDHSPDVLLSGQSRQSISSPELPSLSLTRSVDPVGPSPPSLPSTPTSLSSEDVFDYDLIASSAQTVQDHSKVLSQPLNSYNIIRDSVKAAGNAAPETERQSNRLSLRHLLQSLISPFGRANKARDAPLRISAAAETGQMEFDDNWSIHDTLRDKSGNDSKRCLRNVFDDYEVRSLAESVDFNRDDGKDHSVRNWKDFMEKSGGGGGGGSEESPSSGVDPLTAAVGKLSDSSGPFPTVLDAVTADIKPKVVAGAEPTPVAGRLSGKFRKSKSKTEMMEEIRSNRSSSSGSRLASASSPSGLNSTLPSRRNHGMMQSLDSIFPASKLPSTTTTTEHNQQRHYQKRHESEPRKRSAAAAAKGSSSSALLSPVVRRRLRSLNGKK